MVNKTRPSKIYTTTSINNHGSYQEEYTSDEQIDRNQSQQWKENFAIAKFLRIAKTSIH
jgi:hypothetical protein